MHLMPSATTALSIAVVLCWAIASQARTAIDDSSREGGTNGLARCLDTTSSLCCSRFLVILRLDTFTNMLVRVPSKALTDEADGTSRRALS